MSLDFTASGSRVNHGSAASLDDIPGAGPITLWAWVYRTANGANQHTITKDGGAPAGWLLICDNVVGEGAIRFVCFRASTVNDTISAVGRIPLNTWVFIAATYNDSSTPEARLYYGTLTASVIEEASYYRQQNGAGAYSTDVASDLWVGNLQRASTLPFKGYIQRGGVINRELTAGELRTLQFGTLAQCNVAGTKLLFDYSAPSGTQADRSGNTNNGTITTASAAVNAPLRAFAA